MSERATLIKPPPLDPNKSSIENVLELTPLSDIGPVSKPACHPSCSSYMPNVSKYPDWTTFQLTYPVTRTYSRTLVRYGIHRALVVFTEELS